MPQWSETVGYAAFSAAVYTVATLCGCFLLSRHALLLNSKLHPHDFSIWNWCRLCVSSLTFGLYQPKLYVDGEFVRPGVFAQRSSSLASPSASPKSGVKPIHHRSYSSSFQMSVSQKIHHRIIHYGTPASAVLFTLSVLFASLVRFGQDGFGWLSWYSGCQFTIIATGSSWINGKLLMYLVFVSRLYSAFDGTIFAYPSWLFRILHAILVISIPSLTLWEIMTADGTRVSAYESTKPGSKKSRSVSLCDSYQPTALVSILTAMDVFFTVSIVGLFVRALRQTFKQCSQFSHNMDTFDAEMRLLPLKYTVISSVGVLSTVISLLTYAITNASFVVGIDILVNITCLLLITTLWRPAYIAICMPLLRCVLTNNPEMSALLDKIIEDNQKQREMFDAKISRVSVRQSNYNATIQRIMKDNKGIITLEI